MAQNLRKNQVKINSSIFREYDIRGVVGETLFEEDAFLIGKSFASLVQKKILGKKIVVAYDGRISSTDLEKRIIEGITSTGADVIKIGLGPTPMLYFAVHHFNADGGVMITGSHNPKDHNGFKFMIGKSSLYGEGIKKLRENYPEC